MPPVSVILLLLLCKLGDRAATVAGDWVLLEGVDATSECFSLSLSVAILQTETGCAWRWQPIRCGWCGVPAVRSTPFFSPSTAVTKTATIVPEFLDEEVHIFKPLAALTQAVVKIATEPLNPSELPKMVGWLTFLTWRAAVR